MIKIPFLILFSICLSWLSAQQEIFFIDEANKPISNVTLYFTESKIAYLSDDNGLVFIKHNFEANQVFRIEHLSYKTLELKTPLLEDTLILELNAYQLIEFSVNRKSPIQIIEDAINKIKVNYPQDENYSFGNYIQVHKENHTYVRYIEAFVNVKHAGYRPEIKQSQEESFQISELRRSYNYEKNGDKHGDHLVDLFSENPLQYLEKGILNPKNLNQYTWSIKTDGVVFYEIEFKNKAWNLLKNYTGIIQINKTNDAIEYMKILEYPNKGTNIEIKGNWEFLNGWYEIKFKRNDEIYAVDFCNKWYHHIVWNAYNPTRQDFLVEELFVWENLETNSKKKDNYSIASNLYSKELILGERLKEKKLDSELRKDLEYKHTLEYQFKNP